MSITPYHKAEIEFAAKPTLRRHPFLQEMGEIEANGVEHYGSNRCACCIKYSQRCIARERTTSGTARVTRCTFCISKRWVCSLIAESIYVYPAPSKPPKSKNRVDVVVSNPPRSEKRGDAPPPDSSRSSKKKKRDCIDPATWPEKATEDLLDLLDAEGSKLLKGNKEHRLDKTLMRIAGYLNGVDDPDHSSYYPGRNYRLSDVESQLTYLCKKHGAPKGNKGNLADVRGLIKGGRKRLMEGNYVPPQRSVPADDPLSPAVDPLSPENDALSPADYPSSAVDLPSPADDTTRTPPLEPEFIFIPNNHPHPRIETEHAPIVLRTLIRTAVHHIWEHLPSLCKEPPAQPDLHTLETSHPDLYALLQRTFCTRGQDATALAARLADLEIPTLAAPGPLRALVAVWIQARIFESDFPESVVPDMQRVLWQTHKRVTTRKYGAQVWRTLLVDTLSNHLRDPAFSPAIIPPYADILLPPLLSTLTFFFPSLPSSLLESLTPHLHDLLQKALAYKLTMMLDPQPLELVWPCPGELFDPVVMEADALWGEGAGVRGKKVRYALMPAVLAASEEEEDVPLVLRVLVKALVML